MGVVAIVKLYADYGEALADNIRHRVAETRNDTEASLCLSGVKFLYCVLLGADKYFSMGISKYINSSPFPLRIPVT